MNEVIMKSALKMLKNFISPEQIKGAARSLIDQAIDYKNTVALEGDETQTAAIFYEVEGTTFFALAMLTEDNHITRFESVRPLDELIDELIQKI